MLTKKEMIELVKSLDSNSLFLKDITEYVERRLEWFDTMPKDYSDPIERKLYKEFHKVVN
jgi:hypothetical protein